MSPTRVAHELLGRTVVHPEHRHRRESETSEEKFVPAHQQQRQPQRQPTPPASYEAVPEYEADRHVTERQPEHQVVEHQRESRPILDQRETVLQDEEEDYNEVDDDSQRQYEPDHPLATPTHPLAGTKMRAVALYDYNAGTIL